MGDLSISKHENGGVLLVEGALCVNGLTAPFVLQDCNIWICCMVCYQQCDLAENQEILGPIEESDNLPFPSSRLGEFGRA
jgi:hypothetical protein